MPVRAEFYPGRKGFTVIPAGTALTEAIIRVLLCRGEEVDQVGCVGFLKFFKIFFQHKGWMFFQAALAMGPASFLVEDWVGCPGGSGVTFLF